MKYEQPTLFDDPNTESTAPSGPVEVRIDGPLSSANGDPYDIQAMRTARDLEIAEAVHAQAAANRASGRAALAGVRAQLARPEGWETLTPDEQLANWDVPADGTVKRAVTLGNYKRGDSGAA